MILKQKHMSAAEVAARLQIQPGVKLYGFCGGLFGRESYGEKTVVEIRGKRIVFTEGEYMETSREIDGETYTWMGLIESSNCALESDDH